ncbi:hypothetical protein TorRG33x02_090770, partial [Trema orientale]
TTSSPADFLYPRPADDCLVPERQSKPVNDISLRYPITNISIAMVSFHVLGVV